jgi:hypothetical protein
MKKLLPKKKKLRGRGMVEVHPQILRWQARLKKAKAEAKAKAAKELVEGITQAIVTESSQTAANAPRIDERPAVDTTTPENTANALWELFK